MTLTKPNSAHNELKHHKTKRIRFHEQTLPFNHFSPLSFQLSVPHTRTHTTCMKGCHGMCKKMKCADRRVSEGESVGMLWNLKLLCKSHSETQMESVLLPFHNIHNSHTWLALHNTVPCHTSCIFSLRG